MRSIRGRLTLTLSILVVAIVLGFATIGAFAVPSILLQRDSDRLQAASERVLTSLRLSGGVTLGPDSLQNYVANDLGVVLLTGDEIVGSAGLPEEDVSSVVHGSAAASTADAGTQPVADHYLAARIDVTGLDLVFADDGATSPISTIVLSLATSARDATTSLIVTALVVVALATTTALIATAAVVVGRGLRPLADMADRAERIADGDRTLRLEIDDAGDPAIARVAHTVNTAFDAQEDAENRMRAFIADASHELRTPLTAAHGWIELYLRGGLHDAQQRDAAMIRVERQLQRLRELADELSLLTRTDAGRPLEVAEVDLGALARDVVYDARIVHPDRDVAVEVEGRPIVLGDAPRLAQVLRNLVGNALQHASGTVEVRVLAGDLRHVLRVHDSGPGIGSEALPHIFERFWRGDSARAAPGGSGLGLAIVQAIVSAHDGTISVRSSPEAGTTFEVSMAAHSPRRQA